MVKVRLRDIAHSRAGDKGDVSNLSLIPYCPEDYQLLVREVTAERVRAWMNGLVRGEVKRYEMPYIAALNFVLEDCLAGGVTRSLAMDAHGKSLSGLFLEMEIETNAPIHRLGPSSVRDERLGGRSPAQLLAQRGAGPQHHCQKEVES